MAAKANLKAIFSRRLVDQVTLINRLMAIPYVRGRGDATGCDCWGLVEFWYRERLGIELQDRSNIEPGPSGLAAGFANQSQWVNVEFPQNDDLVILRSRWNGETLDHGHCGIFWNGNLIHTEEQAGPSCQPMKARQIASRVTCYLRHVSLQ